MTRLRPDLVLQDLEKSLQGVLRIAAAAHQWMDPRQGPLQPKFDESYKVLMLELAFLQGYLAWERFLEQSFILYLWGKRSPSRYAPKRNVVPMTRSYAEQLTRDGKLFVDWDKPSDVIKRAKRFFANGDPYNDVLGSHPYLFKDLGKIRNAAVHRSSHSREEFESVVKRELTNVPPDITVGTFLDTTIKASTPPISYMEHYFHLVIRSARDIIPS